MKLPRPAAWVLAVVAHPDDESFGLGAVLSAMVQDGARVSVLCLTHGEASTLSGHGAGELAAIRAQELATAAAELGVTGAVLKDFADGTLADVDPATLDAAVEQHVGNADLLVAFERDGVTGHPDHRAATAATMRVAERHGLAVLEWGVGKDVAAALNRELHTGFQALHGDGVVQLNLDRVRQRAAIACHTSQAHNNPILARRLALQGDREWVRYSD